MSEQKEKTFYCEVGDHTALLGEYEENLYYCGFCSRAFCPEHAGNVKVSAGSLLPCKDHISEILIMNDRSPDVQSMQGIIRRLLAMRTSERTEVVALKQRVHHLECLLDDCARELASLQTRFGVDLREFIGQICDNIPESEEEKAWLAQPSIDPAILKEIQDILEGKE